MLNSINSTPLDDDRPYRPKQAAQKAQVSVGTIYVWGHEGRFKWWTVKRRGFERGIRYIDRASFENFLKSQREEIPA